MQWSVMQSSAGIQDEYSRLFKRNKPEGDNGNNKVQDQKAKESGDYWLDEL